MEYGFNLLSLIRIFQKNINLIVSLYFINKKEVNYGQVAGICLILAIALVNYKYECVILA